MTWHTSPADPSCALYADDSRTAGIVCERVPGVYEGAVIGERPPLVYVGPDLERARAAVERAVAERSGQ